ncbi:MAG: site-2 protease family protein [Candidatus Peribacteraceae bacterium]|nr:site-2 protease family protein [Candidatus Peribacteraceae bacterium]
MTVIISALAFLLLLSFLVLIHECGHYFAARWAGVVVEEFGFGLPPRAKTLFRSGGTRFSLNWIPFGGFVRLQGENAADEHDRRHPGSFAHASIPARVIILVAGVFMNFLFAILIFTIGFSLWSWIPTYLSMEEMKEASQRGEITLSAGVRIAMATPDGTAAKAKVPVPAMLLAVDGNPVYIPTDVVDAQAGKQRVTYTLRTETDPPKDVTMTVPVREGKTGIEIQFAPTVTSPSRSVPAAFMLSLREAKVTTVQTVLGISQLFRSLAARGTVPEGITGIVGIAQLTHSSVQQGFLSYMRLMAVLSLSLAILNILPFPSLDGGRLLFVLIEAIAQRPAPRRFELITNTVGFLVLILLILLVTFNDIWKLF